MIHIRTKSPLLFQQAWKRMSESMNAPVKYPKTLPRMRGDFRMEMGADYYLAWVPKGRLPTALPRSWRHR